MLEKPQQNASYILEAGINDNSQFLFDEFLFHKPFSVE